MPVPWVFLRSNSWDWQHLVTPPLQLLTTPSCHLRTRSLKLGTKTCSWIDSTFVLDVGVVTFSFSLYSIGWLRLLHHCLTHVGDLEAMMASAAAPTANLLQTCAALLMSPYCGMHSPNIEAVLVKIGLQSTRIGLKLIDILLRNCAASGTDPASESYTGASLRRQQILKVSKKS